MSIRKLKDYAKDVRTVQWFICAIPLGGRLFQKQAALAFPPLGPDMGTIVFISIAFTGLAAILPWAFALKRAKVPLIICSVLLFTLFLSYFCLFEKYVVSIPIPDNGNISVSIGYVRTEFANENFGDMTDAEMLKERGPYETEVQKLWTKDSIDTVRLQLFGSYLGTLILLNICIGIFAKGGAESSC